MSVGYEEEQNTLGIPLYSSSTVSIEQNDGNNGITLKAKENYSEYEEEIGTWIDGKPIYRKVSNVTISNKSTWTSLISISNLDKLINVYGFCKNVTLPRYESSNYYVQFLFENNYLKYMANGISGSAFIVTEYTKTTDTGRNIIYS